MDKPRILIVGGVAGGASAATRARRMNEHAEIIVFEAGDHVSFANCGLPYYVGGQIADRNRLLIATPEYFKSTFNIDVRTGHVVTAIDRQNKRIEVRGKASGQTAWEPYDKLILSTGANPIVPEWEGVRAANVFTLRDLADTDRIKAYVDEQQPKRAVIVGAGYIGLEMVEALVARGVQVSLVQQQEQVLILFDREMAEQMEAVLRGQGVDLHLGCTLESLKVEGDRVTGVRLTDPAKFKPRSTCSCRQQCEFNTDMVLLAMGVKPNTKLAEEAGLDIGKTGAVAVNEYSQTSDADIYAVGDVAEVMHRVTGKPARVPLAGPANRNGRLAGEHAATGRSARAPAVVGTAVLGLFGKTAASTGLNVKAAQEAGFDAGWSYAIRGNHVGYYPGSEQMILKLVYDRGTRRVLGAQGVGGAGVDKRIDVVATLLHFGGTIDDLAGLDLAYAPQYGAAKDPVHIAAFVACNEADGLSRQRGVDEALGDGEAVQIVDVRTEREFAAGALPGAINMPLSTIRRRLDELDRDRPVYVYCGVGQRAHNALRILMQHGFQEVWNLAGGATLHLKDK